MATKKQRSKKRTPAQIAATKKMLAARKRTLARSPKKKTTRRKKNPGTFYGGGGNVIASLNRSTVVYFDGRGWGARDRAANFVNASIAKEVAQRFGRRKQMAVVNSDAKPAEIREFLQGKK